MKNRGEILYVVVLFGQRLEQCNAYNTLLHDRISVFIQNNSPQSDFPATIPEKWHYIEAPHNPGLSAAYNKAAKFAKEHGFKWLMITDQDTVYAPGAAERYEKYAESGDENIIFIPKVKLDNGEYLSPVKKRMYMSHPDRKPLGGRINLSDSAIINSGLLISLEAFEACGGYNEKVFLDFSDFQFIDRMSKVNQYGEVMEEEIFQHFSGREDRDERQLARFRLFCKSLSGYEGGVSVKAQIAFVALKRCLSLCVKRRSLSPAGIYLSNFLRIGK